MYDYWHVTPTNDVFEHDTEHQGMCWCNPKIEKQENGNYRSMTLDQYLEKRIADLIDKKINESLDKVQLMVVRSDQQEEQE